MPFDQVDFYLDEMPRSGTWRAQTVLDARCDFEQFKQILGDMPVAVLSPYTYALQRARAGNIFPAWL